MLQLSSVWHEMQIENKSLIYINTLGNRSNGRNLRNNKNTQFADEVSILET